VKDVLLTGAVRVNGEPEERRGRQLRKGDVVSVEGMEDVRVA
jgi:ribosome-associated protein